MHRKLLSFLVLLGLLFNANAQTSVIREKPDYDNIERITKDKSLATYYPKLFKRYENDDTTLSAADYRLLYYGFFFQDNFSSLGDITDVNDSIKAIYSKDSVSDKDRLKLIRFTKESLKSAPYDLKNINRLCRLYNALGEIEKYNAARYKLKMIVRTIMTSGDGRSDETGFHVISVGDEYSILSLLGLESTSQTLTANQCDYLELAPNQDGIKGLYFDVKQIFAGYSKALFNNLPQEKKQKGKK